MTDACAARSKCMVFDWFQTVPGCSYIIVVRPCAGMDSRIQPPDLLVGFSRFACQTGEQLFDTCERLT